MAIFFVPEYPGDRPHICEEGRVEVQEQAFGLTSLCESQYKSGISNNRLCQEFVLSECSLSMKEE